MSSNLNLQMWQGCYARRQEYLRNAEYWQGRVCACLGDKSVEYEQFWRELASWADKELAALERGRLIPELGQFSHHD